MFNRSHQRVEVDDAADSHGEEHVSAADLPASQDHDEHADGSVIGRLRPSLASLMVEEGVASAEQLEAALAEGQQTGERLGEVVLRHGWINEAGLAGLVARQWDLSFVALSMITLDEAARALVSREVCQRLGACPVSFDDGVPLVAVADPSEDRFASVRAALGTPCSFFVTTASALTRLIDQQESAAGEPQAVTADDSSPAGETTELASVPEPPATEAPGPTLVVAESDDGGEPVVDQLDRLLDQLVQERQRSGEELGGYQRQLSDLQDEQTRLQDEHRRLQDEQARLQEEQARVQAEQARLLDDQARVQKSIRSLESRLGEEEHRLDSMRTKLDEYTQSFTQH
jgi:phage shock protein A